MLCRVVILSALALGPAQAYLRVPLNSISLVRSPVASSSLPVISMRCRNNLKKEKRLRNRVNAFRFKKVGGNKFFNRFADKSASQATETADGEWMSAVFTYSAMAAAAEAAA